MSNPSSGESGVEFSITYSKIYYLGNIFNNNASTKKFKVLNTEKGQSKDGPIVEDRALGIYPNSVYALYSCI